MKLIHRMPAPRDEGDHLVPLINIVFLILIFFMIAGQITAADAFKVEPPVSEQGQGSDSGKLQVLMDSDGRLALNGESITLEGLTQRVSEQMQGASVEQAPAASSLRVTLKVDAGTSAGTLRPLLASLHGAGVQKIDFITEVAP